MIFSDETGELRIHGFVENNGARVEWSYPVSMVVFDDAIGYEGVLLSDILVTIEEQARRQALENIA